VKKLLCVIGPSGSGKSTYVHYVKEKMHFGEIISTTTRVPRKGEIDGVDYHFVSHQEFLEMDMIQRDEYANQFYGTAQKDLDNAYQNNDFAFMVVTYEGAQMFKKLFVERNFDIEVVTVFIYTPIEELRQRMIHRGDDIEKVNERIDNIQKRKEYENKEKTDYVFYVDINHSLEESCENFQSFIMDIIER
jgi:Guanylate kinase